MKKGFVTVNNAIGLDIGSAFVRIAQVSKDKNIKTAFEKIPPSLSTEERNNFIVQSIKRLIAVNHFKKGPIFLSVPQSECCVRTILIPVMAEHEIPEAVKWASRRHIAYALEETVLSYTIAGEVMERQTKKIKIVFMAILKEVFEKYTLLLKKTGLRLSCLSTGCFALTNVGSSLGLLSEKTEVIVDIGQSGANITFFKDKQMVFTRNVAVGISHFDEIIQEGFEGGLIPQKLEDLKNKFGIIPNGTNTSEDNELIKYAAASWGYIEKLVQEIQLSFRHYSQISHGEEVQKIALCGAGSLLKNLAEQLVSKLSVPVGLMGLPNDYKIDGDFAPFVTAVGMALENGSNPNLILANSSSKKAGFFQGQGLLKQITIAIAALLIFRFGWLLGAHIFYNNQVKIADDELTALDDKNSQLMSIKRKVAKLHLRKEIFLKLSSEPSLSQILVKLSWIIDPNKVVLTSARVDNATANKSLLILQGEIKGSKDSDNLSGVLDDVIAELNKTKYFKKVVPSIHESTGMVSSEKVLAFTIECQINNDLKKSDE